MDEIVGRTLGIGRQRVIGMDGLEEHLRVVNHAARELTLPVVLGLGSDAADIFEVRGYPRLQRGRLLPVAVTDRPGDLPLRRPGRAPAARPRRLLGRRAVDQPGRRGRAPAPTACATTCAAVHLRWDLRLDPGEERDLSWTIWATTRPAPDAADDEATSRARAGGPVPDPSRGSRPTRAPRPTTPGSAARRPSPATTSCSTSWSSARSATCACSSTTARGPTSATSRPACRGSAPCSVGTRSSRAFQSLAVRPRLAVETLTTLAAYQATEDDPRRDAEPGKILHELRTGEMARNGELPHTPYYGSVDSTPLWLILLGRDVRLDRRPRPRRPPVAQRAGRAGLDRPLRRPRRRRLRRVRAALRRAASSTRAGRTRRTPSATGPAARPSPRSPWPRSRATCSTPSGAWPPSPGCVATRTWRPAWRPTPRRSATASRRRSGSRTSATTRWPSTATSGRPMPSAPTPGSACGPASSAPERARDVVDQLLRPAMFSGWGIRTYATGQPGFNPIGYHTGTVWPHDTSLIAAGFKRYGFDDASNRLAGQMLEAAQRFPDYRLPELFCGFDRTRGHDARCRTRSPARPQAWAAGASFLFLETMLGLRAHADRARARAGPPAPARLAGQGHPDRPAGRRRQRRPAVPSLARARRAPRSCARSATSPSPSGCRRPPRGDAPASCSRTGSTRLREAGSETPRLDAELLLAYANGVDRTAILAHPDAPVGTGPAEAFRGYLDRRATGEPVAYIRGMKEFHGLAFAVDRAGAHPASRDRAARRPRAGRGHAPADRRGPAGRRSTRCACSTWGPAAGPSPSPWRSRCAARRVPAEEVEIVALDVSPDALDLARENAVGHAVGDRLRFVAADLVPPGDARAGTSSLANLPVRPRRRDGRAARSATTFEPALALDGGPDGLAVIGRLLDRLPGDARAATASALLEIGADQGEAIVGAGRRAAARLVVPVVEPDLGGPAAGRPSSHGRGAGDRARPFPDPAHRPRHRRDAHRRRPRSSGRAPGRPSGRRWTATWRSRW